MHYNLRAIGNWDRKRKSTDTNQQPPFLKIPQSPHSVRHLILAFSLSTVNCQPSTASAFTIHHRLTSAFHSLFTIHYFPPLLLFPVFGFRLLTSPTIPSPPPSTVRRPPSTAPDTPRSPSPPHPRQFRDSQLAGVQYIEPLRNGP